MKDKLIDDKTSNDIAMDILGTTNIIRTLYLFIKWALNPNLAVNIAVRLEKEIEDKSRKDDYKYIEAKIIAIGYLNEFFSKYIQFGKSNLEVVMLNKDIDSHKKTGNKIVDALSKLRDIRLNVKKFNRVKNDQVIQTNKSFGISAGIVQGKIINITSTKQKITKGCIGIFPTSGAKYDTQFLKCAGIVFKNGAITSHGAILAREFSIPAIVSPKLEISDGSEVLLNGSTGELKIVDTSI